MFTDNEILWQTIQDSNTGNLITNLAKICGLKTIKNEKDMKIIKGKIPASLNGDNEEVYIFRLGGIKIANIYADGKIEIKATIPAISKTLMSQTKRYNLSINQTLVKSYILKKAKFRTDPPFLIRYQVRKIASGLDYSLAIAACSSLLAFLF